MINLQFIVHELESYIYIPNDTDSFNVPGLEYSMFIDTIKKKHKCLKNNYAKMLRSQQVFLYVSLNMSFLFRLFATPKFPALIINDFTVPRGTISIGFLSPRIKEQTLQTCMKLRRRDILLKGLIPRQKNQPRGGPGFCLWRIFLFAVVELNGVYGKLLGIFVRLPENGNLCTVCVPRLSLSCLRFAKRKAQ